MYFHWITDFGSWKPISHYKNQSAKLKSGQYGLNNQTSTIAVAVSTASLSKQATTTESSPPPVLEEDEVGHKTDLNAESTDTKGNQDISNWSEQEKIKLKQMTEFYTEYQHVFGEKAFIRTIMKKRMYHMNPLMQNQSVKKRCEMLS